MIYILPRCGRLPNVSGRGCLSAGVSGSVHGDLRILRLFGSSGGYQLRGGGILKYVWLYEVRKVRKVERVFMTAMEILIALNYRAS